MSMSRKDYRLIANAIRFRRNKMKHELGDTYHIDRLAEELATDLKQDNIHFDTTRFLEACGI